MVGSDFFTTSDGIRLYRRSWGKTLKGVVVLIHGFADHLGRYRFLIQALTERGYAVEGFDLRGHGQSGGVRGHVEKFDLYLEDLALFLEWVQNKHPDRPVFLLGHSHGGHIALRYSLHFPKSELQGVIVSSPFLGFKQQPPIAKRLAARVASQLWPTFRETIGLQIDDLSHDPDVIDETKRDPLYGQVTTARWYRETKKAMASTLRRADRFPFPLLMQLAGEERIVDRHAGHQFFEAVKLSDKHKIEYSGYFHELYNETPDRRGPVFEDLGSWLGDHLPHQSHPPRSTPTDDHPV